MRTILITFVLTFFVTASFGVPAKKSWQTYRQKDGTTIRLQLTGDEYMHYFVTRDGLPYTKCRDRRQWQLLLCPCRHRRADTDRYSGS